MLENDEHAQIQRQQKDTNKKCKDALDTHRQSFYAERELGSWGHSHKAEMYYLEHSAKVRGYFI